MSMFAVGRQASMKDDDSKRREEYENQKKCCICNTTKGTQRLQPGDAKWLSKVFDRAWLTDAMSICDVCQKIAADNVGKAAGTAPTAVTVHGEWRCHKCGTTNSPVARVCDSCGARREAHTQGAVYAVQLGHRAEELGLDCSIQYGAVTITRLSPGGAAEKVGVPLGILTQVDGRDVHSAGDLKRFVGDARAAVKNAGAAFTINLRVLGRESIQQKAHVAAAPRGRASPTTAVSPSLKPTVSKVTPELRNLFGGKAPAKFGLDAPAYSGSTSSTASIQPPAALKTAASKAADDDDFDFNPRANEPPSRSATLVSSAPPAPTTTTPPALPAGVPITTTVSMDDLFGSGPPIPAAQPAAPAAASGAAFPFPDASSVSFYPASAASLNREPSRAAPFPEPAFPAPAQPPPQGASLFPPQPASTGSFEVTFPTTTPAPAKPQHVDPFPF
eukprot:TRINITY_DN13390_c0_g1_i1.p1 TRINITY_DN13390_c0_g1~~TRINITY_DN13390_c0_g1_i1.p1  ORF type:complete len:445 (+),score=99.78 TRINITY_DN13390_c0_g1_i1:70-1404(+)